MRAQRRPGVTATLVHLVDNQLGDTDVTTTTTITGAVFEPDPQPTEGVDQTRTVYRSGVFNLPGVYVAEPGDTLVVDGEQWRVLADGAVWLNRTRVPVAADTMPDTVSLRAPGGTSGWSEANHRTETIPHSPFATGVPARVQALTSHISVAGEVLAADDAVRVAGYLLALPLTGAAGADSIVIDGENNTLIDVTAATDPLLVGKTLRVVDIVRGSHRAERHLLCTLND